LSNDFRLFFYSEGGFLKRKSKIVFINSDCEKNKNSPTKSLGDKILAIFTNSNFLYLISAMDTALSHDPDNYLLIYNSKYKLISKIIFKKLN
jgi:hypothetical protein